MIGALKAAALAYEATWSDHLNFVIASIARDDLAEIVGWLDQNKTTLVSQSASFLGISEADYLDSYSGDLNSDEPRQRAWAERQVAMLQEVSACEFWDYTQGDWQTRDDAVIRLVRTINLDDVAALTTWAHFVQARLFLEDEAISHSRAIIERMDKEEEVQE
jgi:hypothetical protein